MKQSADLNADLSDDFNHKRCNSRTCVFCLADAAIFQRLAHIKKALLPQHLTKDDAALELMRSFGNDS